MAQYPIKMLSDEQGNPFVPLVSPEAVRDVLDRDWESMIKDKMDQLDPMPVPSEDLLNKIVQYKGTTDANYTQGFFYKCISDGGVTPVYSWILVDVQDLSNYLAKDNLSSYTPSADYHPATKKYVDDGVSAKQNTIDSAHKLSADLVDDSSATNKFVTASDKTNWNGKGTYSKPSGGIPSTDLASGVQISLSKADTALQSSDLDNYLSKTNTTSYTPSANYHPATKKYVDDNIVNDTYSTSETATNKIWIDGKPIYRKVINVSDLTPETGTSEKEIAHGITNMDKIVHYDCIADTGLGTYFDFKNYTWTPVNETAWSSCHVYVDNTNVSVIYEGPNYINWVSDVYFVLEYTKASILSI